MIVDLPGSRGPELAAELGERVGSRRPTSGTRQQVQAAVEAAADWAPCGSWSTAPESPRRGGCSSKRGCCRWKTSGRVVEINLVGTFNVLRLAAERDGRQRAGATATGAS